MTPGSIDAVRSVVAGGAGFLGSHICDLLIARGDSVVCVDNLSTGSFDNVAHLESGAGFAFIHADICDGFAIDGVIDTVYNMASPASPKDYLRMPIATLDVGSTGTRNCIDLALRTDATLLMASTSEVYGEPLVHPQPESYWGNVNPIGVRSVYDEAKRFSEAMVSAFARERGLNARLARIFNTYGPRMGADDGRVVSNFVVQALRHEPLTLYGDGSQTRSFCYVDDLVGGLVVLADSTLEGPTNIGNPNEITIRELAQTVIEVTGSTSSLAFESLPSDDPSRRRPDITRAKTELGWSPTCGLVDGIKRTAAYFEGLTTAA